MKNLILAFSALVGTLFLAAPASAQQMTYGNEWINFSQKYYKIKVPATGIYKLDYAYLQAAGISGVDPRQFQLFRRGKEVSIYVSGESDGSFDAADYIEFYGEKNDGALDKELYKDPSLQVNPHYSLYTDTASYFLTWSTGNGKRMVPQTTASSGLTTAPWYWQTRLYQETGTYARGARYSDTNISWADSGEGYFSSSFSASATRPSREFKVDSVFNVFQQGPNPTVEVALVGSNSTPPDIDVYVVEASNTERFLGNLKFPIFSSGKGSFSLPLSSINASGQITFKFYPKNAEGAPGGAFHLSYIKIKYPQRPVLYSSSLSLELEEGVTNAVSYAFEGSNVANAVVYDISVQSEIKRMEGYLNAAQKSFTFPASNASKRMGFLWAKTPLVPLPAKLTEFRSLSGSTADYLMISHASLMLAAGGSSNPVKEYATYRASSAGGSYDTLTLEVNQLYDQFFYGDKSPASIRRFVKFMLANGKPRFLFLIGKGVEISNVNLRKNPQSLQVKDLVPTGGVPGSDIFFTANWETGEYYPLVATGRIPASTPQQVMDYLNKVKEHESLPQNLEWRKNILHLGGGIEGSERLILANYLKGFERIAEGKWFGANVSTKLKSSVAGVDTINIAKELNAGVTLVTFFGHSSTSYSDLDIGLVSNVLYGYKNEDRYPFLLMNGCDAGNSFIPTVSFGEDWLLTANKGAVGFLAHASLGIPSLMNVFSSNFYKTVFADAEFYGKTIGEQHAQTLKTTSLSLNGGAAIAMFMEMVLQSDPGLVLIGPEKPDYKIAEGGVSIQPIDEKVVTANSQKFAVKVDVQNLGKVEVDSFYVSVNRILANGNSVLYDSILVPPVYYRDTITVELEGNIANAAGNNTFEIKLDHTEEVAELDETNNTASLEYFLSQSGVLALGPQEYSIVNTSKVKLIGQSTDLLMPARDYYFELDTTYTFNSVWKKTSVVTSSLLPIWEVDLSAQNADDSLVYYWRMRYNSFGAGEDTVWASSSFRYMPNDAQGWSQAHFGQLARGDRKNLLISERNKRNEFSPLFKTVELKSGGGQHKMSFTAPYGIFIDGNSFLWDNCGFNNPNIYAIVFNNVTLEPYTALPGGTTCGFDTRIVFNFSNLSSFTQRNRLETFLKAVPEGYYVAMVGINAVPYASFNTTLKDAFKGIGSKLIDELQTGDPFAIIGVKGAASGTAIEIGADETDAATPRDLQTVRLEKTLQVNDKQGTLTSTLIGPATKWSSLHHQMVLESSDSYQLDVIGVDEENSEKVLSTNVTSSTFDLSNINAATYPYLKLRLTLKDETQRTAPQLKEWTVLYEGVPEGVLRPDLVGLDKYQKISEQAATGQVDIQFAFHNISDRDFSGPLTVETILFEENGNRIAKDYKLEALQKGDTVYFQHKFSTVNMKGENRLRVTVNPRNHPDMLLEQNYFNNTLELPFTVGLTAGMPPVLDVVFDGVRILDGDIVSPSPVISMQLKDNNKMIPITDPTSMKVYLKKPGAEFVEIDVASDPNVRWYPADDKNDFRVEYNPESLADGKYTLEVQGYDALGQRAGDERYSINFEVVNESAISNFYPYPNPFSSKTKFIFTLTGNKVPDKMKLQIMTVTGKVIREVQKEELGPIKIGNNISEFAWDGTDEYGDRLANGVYLYRVVMENGPEEMKHRATAADKAFKKGYGKIYILR